MRPDPGTAPEPAAPMRAALCYVMCPSAEEALAIARRLVEERLAACGNVLPGAVSVYRWQGAVQEAGEAALVLKTRAELAPALWPASRPASWLAWRWRSNSPRASSSSTT